MDYNGVRYYFCCGGCDYGFTADPVKALKSENSKGKTIGLSLFDPTTGKRVDQKKAKGGFSDYEGVRFFFASEQGKSAFDADPKKYGVMPAKESLVCPVMNKKVTYTTAESYVDVKGVRYYLCCEGCEGIMKKDPSKFVGAAGKNVSTPKPVKAPKK